jgi:subtilisin family serine protease
MRGSGTGGNEAPGIGLRGLLAAGLSLALLGTALTPPAHAAAGGAAPEAAAPGGAADPTPDVAAELRAEVAAAPGERVQALLILPSAGNLGGNPDMVVPRLRAHARQLQDEVEVALEQTAQTQGDVTVVNRFWIKNMLLVEFTASEARLAALAGTPGVERVLPNFAVTAPPEPAFEARADLEASIVDGRITWGMDRIGAERVWNELGLDGTGVRVVTLDTGVAIDHPDLAGKMYTANPADPSHPGGWMEFGSAGQLVESQPRDTEGHGTHVSGTIHGGATSGVIIGGAPGAELAHGLVIPAGTGTFTQVVAGMQWAIAPTDADGNPAGRPADVVNMSLGIADYAEEVIAPTLAIVAAGAFPAFAIGNTDIFGSCGVGSSAPGNVYEAVGVGATDVDENVASFSCGEVVRRADWTNPPAGWPDSYVTPDLSAPGVNVWSAAPGGGYRYGSGTSMATPHTAATAALIRQGAPELTVEQMRDTLADTSFWDDRYSPTRPDTRFGEGRIDAYRAVSRVAFDSGVTGRITEAGTGAPIAGATVTVTPGDRTIRTGDDGSYAVRLAPGTYDLTATAFGHSSAAATGVAVVDGEFARVDLALAAQPRGTVAGTVTLDESGRGIPGVEVAVLGIPVDRSAVTDVDGAYRIDLPAGTYQVAASHPVFVAPPPVEVTVPAGGTAAADFAFSPPPQTVALVGDFTDQYVDEVFAPRDIATVQYDWPDLVEAAQHAVVVLAYGVASDYNATRFQQFLDATDANGTGVIFTDHAFGPASGIRQLSQHTGQPESTGNNSGGSGVAESFYEVTAAHPILDGFAVGDRIPFDVTTQAKWIAWFNGYAGAGRRTIADMGRTDATDIYGGGIGVDQRANNRHVLLSTHGVSVTRGPETWTEQATTVFLNALSWAARPQQPGQAYFALHDLQVADPLIKIGETTRITVDIKNVGASLGSHTVTLLLNGEPAASTTVSLGAGVNREIAWTVEPEEIGTYQVSVGYLSDSFRVRAPEIHLVARTYRGPGAPPEAALAGATVELIHDGQVVPAGVTAADGTLHVEAPRAVGRYLIVIRRAAAGAEPAYLLHREITIIDDDTVVFAPQVLASGSAGASAFLQDFAVRAELAADLVDDRHEVLTYLAPGSTAPYAYAYEPGTLIASLDVYRAVHVHRVSRLERDWWLPSEVVSVSNWDLPFDVELAYGGEVQLDVAATGDDLGVVSVDWQATDAHGNPFATVLATGIRPFLDLPDVVDFADVMEVVRGEAPNEQLPILRLFAPDGTELRAGSIGWADRPFTFPVDDVRPGTYRLDLALDTGAYSGAVTAATPLVLAEPVTVATTLPATAVVETRVPYEVTIGNAGPDDLGPAAWDVTFAHPAGDLRPRDVVLQLRVGDAWERVALTRDAGRLVGTVLPSVLLGPESAHTWRMRLLVRTAGPLTVTDRLRGPGVAVDHAATVTVAAG